MTENQTVTIYYNGVDVSEKPDKVLPDCNFVNQPRKEATEYAEKKLSNNEWSSYLIPELTSVETIIEGESDHPQQESLSVSCKCGNSEEVSIEDLDDVRKFVFSVIMFENAYYLCTECMEEVKINIQEL